MKIVDDRGEAHAGDNPMARSVLVMGDFNRMHLVEKRIGQESRRSVLVSEMIGMLLLSIPFNFAGVALITGGVRGEPVGFQLFVWVVALLGLLLVGAALTRPRTLRRELDRLRREQSMLAGQYRGVCRVCRYDLSGLDSDDDGCTVCPE